MSRTEFVIATAIVLFIALRIATHKYQSFQYPGRTIGIFLMGYGISRVIVEFFRQPDAQFVSPGNPLGLAWHIDGLGLTMGQILSLPMIAIGLWFVWWARRATP